MSTAHWRARRLTIPAAWPVRSSPVVHLWAIVSAGLAPILLTGAYFMAGILQPASYSPVRTTISVMAGQAGTDRWVMTGGIVLTGCCYLVTAAGLTGIRTSARALLAVAGLAGIGIAVSPEPARGATPQHLAWTVLGAVTITVWPAFTARRAAAADPERLRLRRRHRRLRRPAQLAARRNPRRQRPGPGRAADLIDPDLLAVHHRPHPAPLHCHRHPANVALTADGCEKPQLAGTSDRRGAICDTELGVDAADLRADRVRRDGQLAGDLGPGQVRGKIPQYPELARAELFYQRRCGLVFGHQG